MINTHVIYRLFISMLLCLNLFACTDSSSNNTSASPAFVNPASISISENTTTVVTVNATNAGNDTITYSISGGADQGLLAINATTGALTFNNAPDFESSNDSDNNNIYLVQVSASDSTNTNNQQIAITITNLNDNSPVFTSAAAISIAENTRPELVMTATDTDNDTVTYSITDGADRALFVINSSALAFINAPDFEIPEDGDSNNIYLVQVTASDGTNTTDQLISVTVSDVDDAFGLTSRPSNTSCIIPDAPSTTANIKLTPVFDSISFNKPVALRQSPTLADRWYVVEQAGRIKTFLTNDSAATDFADLTDPVSNAGNEMGLLGMAFHPDFATNNYVYVYYSSTGGSLHHQSVISRFEATSATVLDLSTETEMLRIDQPYSNHNGGNILFGPDGYLYIGMGDGGSAGDPGDRSQDTSTLLGKMLRIDVDNPANSNNYSSPVDNPFVGTAGLDEIFALGLRNPWRWSFDRQTGDLIAGDVGQNAWEEIDIISNGGNYGWRCYEGNHAYNTSGCLSQNSYIGPIYEYGHGTGSSITGGYVYRGSAIPALQGTYLYSDFYPSPIWGLSYPTGTPVNAELISSNALISSFAEDNNGELYVVTFDSGIHRIDPASSSGGTFPALLSQTGCIDTNAPLQMAAGLIPYEINAPFWSDGVAKDRWMAVPDAATINIELNHDWTYPNNSVLVKNFSLNGKRVETRLLVRHENGDWRGYSYEWNDSETDANLLLDGKVTSKQSPTGPQTYIYPSSTECMICHTVIAGIALGPETSQLNRDTTYPSTGATANQLATLNHIGMFTNALTDVPANLPRLTEPSDLNASDHDRSRAYLYINCAHCHQAGGPANASIDFHIDTADADMNICNATPTHQIGSASAIMTPGDATDSTMYLRMSCREDVGSCVPGDEMPPLGSVLVDTDGAIIVESWINSSGICP